MKKIMFNLKPFILYAIMFFLAFNLSGCLGAMQSVYDSKKKDNPSYMETEKNWGTIPDGCGRVVIFYPKQSSSGAIVFFGVPSQRMFRLEGDKKKQFFLNHKTFMFTDFSVGKHLLRGLSTGKAEFEVKSGEILYINILNYNVSSKQEVEQYLGEIYHTFKEPLPVEKQNKSAKRV